MRIRPIIQRLLVLVCVLVFLLASPMAAMAQHFPPPKPVIPTDGSPPYIPDLPQRTITGSDGRRHQVPDISQATLEQLRFSDADSFVDRGGRITRQLGFNPSASWRAGTPAADIVNLGTINGTFKREVVLNQLAAYAGVNAANIPLSSVGPVAQASLADLAKGVPRFGQTRVGDSFLGRLSQPRGRGLVQRVFGNRDLQRVSSFIARHPELSQLPINAILSGDFGGIVEGGVRTALVHLLKDSGSSLGFVSIGDVKLNEPQGAIFAAASLINGLNRRQTINQALRQNPQLRKIPLAQLGDLSKVRVGDIPNLANTNLGRIPGGLQSSVSSVPGLSRVPLGQLVSGLNSGVPVLARMDLALSGDGVARRAVSGGTPNNRFRPADCTGGNCPHIELVAIQGFTDMTGRRWVAAESPKVSGGVGPLKNVGGGKEVTGIKFNDNLPFKVVVRKVNDGQGTALVSLYFQQCLKLPFSPKTCTPHIFGPLPFHQVAEKQPLLVANVPAPKPSQKKAPVKSPRPPPKFNKGINDDIMKAVRRLGGFSTRNFPHTANGRRACAAAIDHVLRNAGIRRLGGGSFRGVKFVQRDLLNGRGIKIPRSQARPGDLIIGDLGGKWGGANQHIGICTTNKCTQNISNSSSRAAFVWKSNHVFNGVQGYNSRNVTYYRITER